MTNAILTVLIVTTNWVQFPSDLHRQGGTNKVHEYQLVSTNLHVCQVHWCTNQLGHVSVGEGTNGVERWVPPPLPELPSGPGQFTKP